MKEAGPYCQGEKRGIILVVVRAPLSSVLSHSNYTNVDTNKIVLQMGIVTKEKKDRKQSWRSQT